MAAKPDRLTMGRGWDIEPAFLLPSQMGPRASLTPCQRLCWAVLEAVIHDLAHPELRAQKGSGSRTRPSLRDEALDYIYRVDGYWPFAFDRLCEQLDIEPDAFRLALAKGRAA